MGKLAKKYYIHLEIDKKSQFIRIVAYDVLLGRQVTSSVVPIPPFQILEDEVYYASLALYHSTNQITFRIYPEDTIRITTNSKILRKTIRRLLKKDIADENLSTAGKKMKSILNILRAKSEKVEVKRFLPRKVRNMRGPR